MSSFFQKSGSTTTVENSIDTKVAAAEAAKVAAQAAQAGAETAASSAQSAAASVDSVAADAAAASSNAADALTYKNAAETAKTAAETAQAASETAESNAASSASTASTKASEASTSAANATSSETNSASSATSSATSATASAASASAAATSASNASTSETNAASSASSASTSASTATTQAGIATTKAGEASTSASNASTSESNAASSASNAASSASAASASQSAAAASAASAASAFDSFDDRYLGTFTTAAEPTVDNDGDALVTGALYFNSTEGEMRVYDGSAWISASAATEASLLTYEYTATSGQTTFSGADDNANTLSYTLDNIIVTLNGVVLDPDDYTATSGTSIVLGTGAALNDELNVVAFKSFTTADMVSATNGGTFGNSITVTGTVTATSFSGDGSSLTGISTDLVGDTTPQLGGNLDTNGNNINFGDNDRAIFGASSDLQIWHDSSNSFIKDFGTGSLRILGDELKFLNAGDNQLKITADTNGAVKLYYSGTQKVATTSTGVTITGTITSDGLTVDTDTLYVDSANNRVGIGTTSPSQSLHVSGVGFFDTDVRVNSSSTTPSLSDSISDTGARIRSGGASHLFSSYSDQVLLLNRAGTDGALITFYAQGNSEGSISVSGTTVTYSGGHLARWSRLPNDVVTDIPKGTVMTNLDDMITWTKQDGTVEDNEQLNYTEISSVEGDVNVAGLFDHWDNDDDGQGYDSDFFLAETGDFIIRIAQGTTVQRGDLLMSAGDGTAKPQGDDIVRSKTIAKVTSTNVSHTYDDGSYLVPCVLMAC